MTLTENKHRWDKVFLIAPLFALIIFGYVLSQIAGNVLFVKRIGSEFLPYTYIANAALGTIVTMYLVGTIGRRNIVRMIQVLAAIGALLIGGILIMINSNIIWGYPVLLVSTQLLYMLLGGLMMWDLALKICTPLEGKWAFGYFSLGASIGGILAGITSSVFSGTYGTEFLIPIIIGSLVGIFIICFFINSRYRDDLKADIDNKVESGWEALKNGFRFYKTSRIAKMLSIILLLFYCLRLIGDFEYQKILGDTFSEDSFSRISGIVSIIENGCLIIVFLFIQKIALSKLGVLNTLLASPVIIFVPFLTLFFFPIYLIATALKLIIKIVNYSTFNNSIRLVFTAIPHAVRSSLLAFVGGNAEAAGTLLAGTGLVVLMKFLPNYWVILLGALLSFLLAVIVYFLRREYVKQIIKNLESDDINDVHTAIEDLAEPAYSKVGVNELMKILQHPSLDVETVRKTVFALGKIDNVNVIPSLLDMYGKYDLTVKYAVIDAIQGFTDLNERLKELPFTHLNLIETYQEIFFKEEDPELKIFILEHLKDFDSDYMISFLKNAIGTQDSVVQYQAIKAFKYFHDRGIIRYVKSFLNHEDVMIKAGSVIALWQFVELRPELLKVFINLMLKNNKDSILAVFFIIAKLNIHWEKQYVEKHLDSHLLQLKTMAALTLLQIEDEKGLDIYADTLISKNEFTKILVRNVKELSPKMKKQLFNKIRTRGEESLVSCIENLKNSYLNFGEEIEFLNNSKAHLSMFTGRLSEKRA